MRLRYAGTCRECGASLAAGAVAVYDASSKTVACVECPAGGQSDVFAPGNAGASAQREFERRKAKRENRIRNAHPHLGGLMLALSDDPQSTRSWATGAKGEVVLGKRLDKLVERGFHVLHDRRIPGTKANIDHIVVAPRGVFVIDAKRYKGAPRLQVEGGLFSRRVEKLMVGSRDCTELVGKVRKHVSLVEGALAAAGLADVSVAGMLCFVEADWPLLGGNFVIDGVEALWPGKASDRLTQSGPLDLDQMRAVARALATHFPVA